MKILSKATLLAATAATVVSFSTSAMARDRHDRRDGIDAGDVIAGALIIGGVAAIASAASDNRNDRYRGRNDDPRYNDPRYNDQRYDNYQNDESGYYRNGYSSRAAVEQCVQAASRDASRWGRARVTDVTSINRIRGGYEVKGRLVVANSRYWRSGYNGWDRYGNNYDRYGDNYDKGKFSCVSQNGNIQDVRLSGLRG